MTFAMEWEPRDEVLTVDGRSYRWREGGAVEARAEKLRSKRDALPALFRGALVPALERRGAVREEQRAGRGVPMHRARWVTWRAPGEAKAVWALYVTARWACRDGAPANDGMVLAAWGDGPVLAWAHGEARVRAAVRGALRALPEFLGGGLASADATWPLRVEPTSPSGRAAPPCRGCAS